MSDHQSRSTQRLNALQNVARQGVRHLSPQEFLRLSRAPLPPQLSGPQAFRLGVQRLIAIRQTGQMAQASPEIQHLATHLPLANPDDAFMYHCESTRLHLMCPHAGQFSPHLLSAHALHSQVSEDLQDYLHMILAALASCLQDDERQLLHTRLAARTPPPGHPYHSGWNEHERRASLAWILGVTGHAREASKLSEWAASGLRQDYPSNTSTLNQIRTEGLVYAGLHGTLTLTTPELHTARRALQHQPKHPLHIHLALAEALLAAQQHDHLQADRAFQHALNTSHQLREYGRFAALAHDQALTYYHQQHQQERIHQVLAQRVNLLEQRRQQITKILGHLNGQAAEVLNLQQHLRPHPHPKHHALIEHLDILDDHHDCTGQHNRRVAHLTYQLACRLALPNATDIALASRLHDLGKACLPASLLQKPGPLTPQERQEMQRHTEDGARILAGGSSAVLQLAQVIARHHHEHWDGSGYPDQLKATAIPLAARITAVADVFDALTNERPYKRAWTPEAALTEIIAQSGRQFDPDVVNALTDLLSNSTLKINNPHDLPPSAPSCH